MYNMTVCLNILKSSLKSLIKEMQQLSRCKKTDLTTSAETRDKTRPDKN